MPEGKKMHYPFFNHTDVNELVSGYCRRYCDEGERGYVPDTTIGLILKYYPQFNGTTFSWKIESDSYISEEMNNLSAANRDTLSYDSDFFDIGLPNKFFLRLCPNANQNAETNPCHGSHPRNETPMRSHSRSISPRVGDSRLEKQKFVLQLMSFPLESVYHSIIFHTELYLHCIGNKNNSNNNSKSKIREHSTIWKMTKRERGRRRDPGYHDYAYPMGRNTNRNNRNNDKSDSYATFNWAIGKSKDIIDFIQGIESSDEDGVGDVDDDDSITGNPFEVLFVCKIKVLKVNKGYNGGVFVIHNDCENEYDGNAQRYRSGLRSPRSISYSSSDDDVTVSDDSMNHSLLSSGGDTSELIMDTLISQAVDELERKELTELEKQVNEKQHEEKKKKNDKNKNKNKSKNKNKKEKQKNKSDDKNFKVRFSWQLNRDLIVFNRDKKKKKQKKKEYMRRDISPSPEPGTITVESGPSVETSQTQTSRHRKTFRGRGRGGRGGRDRDAGRFFVARDRIRDTRWDDRRRDRDLTNISSRYDNPSLQDKQLQYHSSIFYDIFQLQCESSGKFSIMICGLPYKTHKMGVKCDMFVCYNDVNPSVNINHHKKQQVMSEMITFDYDFMTKIDFSSNTNRKIMNFFDKYKRITLLCDINVIQRYDGYIKVLKSSTPLFKPKVKHNTQQQQNKNENKMKNRINTKKQETSVTTGNINQQKNEEWKENVAATSHHSPPQTTQTDKKTGIRTFPNLKKEIGLSSKKIVNKFSNDTFVWCIKDEEIISDIKHNTNCEKLKYNSKIFRMLDRRWYLSIVKQEKKDRRGSRYGRRRRYSDDSSGKSKDKRIRDVEAIDIELHCVSASYKPCFTVNIDVIETGNHHEYFGVSCDSGRHSSTCHLKQKVKEIKQLKLKQFTIRVNIMVISDSDSSRYGYDSDYYGYESELEHEDKKNGEVIQKEKDIIANEKSKELLEFEKWIKETVKLTDYMKNFEEHDILDLETVVLMNDENLVSIGITKVGHRLRFLKHIGNLERSKRYRHRHR